MTTRNAGNSSKSTERSESRRQSSKSAFSWGGAGPLLGAAAAGAAIGFAANLGRKFIVQSLSGATGDWDKVLAAEHDMTLALFDKMLATDQSQTWMRKTLLFQLTHALDKHAYEEEMVVYPALREANMEHDADSLNGEHGQIKTFIYELEKMGPDAPNWLEKVREFRNLVEEHARMEEEQVFPKFKEVLTEEQNARITRKVNIDGFWMA